MFWCGNQIVTKIFHKSLEINHLLKLLFYLWRKLFYEVRYLEKQFEFVKSINQNCVMVPFIIYFNLSRIYFGKQYIYYIPSNHSSEKMKKNVNRKMYVCDHFTLQLNLFKMILSIILLNMECVTFSGFNCWTYKIFFDFVKYGHWHSLVIAKFDKLFRHEDSYHKQAYEKYYILVRSNGSKCDILTNIRHVVCKICAL